MKQNYKKLIFPALAIAIFLPLASMAASDDVSLPERAKKLFQHKQTENINRSLEEGRVLQREDRRLENRANHTEMMSILNSGDYNAWLEFVKDKNCSMSSELNEENFSEFVERHKLKTENRASEAKERNQKKLNNFRFGGK